MNNVHALIVDDDANNLGILAEMLALEGIQYTQVQQPSRLPAVLKQLQKVDVVFLDLEMPDMNGYEIFETLKSDARFQSVPIVAYTVHLNEINNARKLGFHSFLGKPIDAELFPQQIKSILKGEHVWSLP